MMDAVISRDLNPTMLMSRAWGNTIFGYDLESDSPNQVPVIKHTAAASYLKLISSLNKRQDRAKELLRKLKQFKEKRSPSKRDKKLDISKYSVFKMLPSETLEPSDGDEQKQTRI